MAPTDFREGGAGQDIRFAIAECWLGLILIAASERGVCAILFGDDPGGSCGATCKTSSRARG